MLFNCSFHLLLTVLCLTLCFLLLLIFIYQAVKIRICLRYHIVIVEIRPIHLLIILKILTSHLCIYILLLLLLIDNSLIFSPLFLLLCILVKSLRLLWSIFFIFFLVSILCLWKILLIEKHHIIIDKCLLVRNKLRGVTRHVLTWHHHVGILLLVWLKFALLIFFILFFFDWFFFLLSFSFWSWLFNFLSFLLFLLALWEYLIRMR